MSRRISALKFAHQLRNLPDPTRNARVVAVWEGIRRTHGAPVEQSAPLMPPDLFDVLDACPTTKTGRLPAAHRNPTWPAPATELSSWSASSRLYAAANWQPSPLTTSTTTHGLVLTLPAPRPTRPAKKTELVVPPPAPPTATAAPSPHCSNGCPWRHRRRTLFRGVGKNNRPSTKAPEPRLHQTPSSKPHHPRRTGRHHLLRPQPARRVRHLRPPARSFRPRHRPPDPPPLLATLGTYVRVQQAWTDNAATQLGPLALREKFRL